MERIRLGFADFWAGFDPSRNYFVDLLRQHFDVELCVELSDQPDFLIYSCFGTDHRRHRCLRIFFTGENVRPDFHTCDYAFTFDHLEHPDHYRLPLYALYGDPAALVKPADFDPRTELSAKSGFCNFVYSNARCGERIKFFHELSKYKQVDSGGKLLNNIGGPVADKAAFVRRYKFTIAFENSATPGYTTEKLIEPMKASSLPIYWGNAEVARDFNPRSFVSYYDHGSFEKLIDRVIELDRDDDKYCEMHRQPWYHDNRVNPYIDPANVVAQFRKIFSTPREPVALKRTWRKVFFLDRLFPTSRPYAKVRVSKARR